MNISCEWIRILLNVVYYYSFLFTIWSDVVLESSLRGKERVFSKYYDLDIKFLKEDKLSLFILYYMGLPILTNIDDAVVDFFVTDCWNLKKVCVERDSNEIST